MYDAINLLDEIEKYYLISETGNIYRIKTCRNIPIYKECKYTKIGNNYYVNINIQNSKKKYKVDYLIALKYVPNPMFNTKIVHKDNDISNNKSNNLVWSEL